MKIQSTLEHNLSVFAKHGSKSSIPAYLTVPAGATLEVDDKIWLDGFASAFAPQINLGSIKVLEAPKSNLTTAQLRKRLSEVGITTDATYNKEKLTQLANQLGIDTTK